MTVFVAVCAHQESFSVEETSAFPQTECVMEPKTVPLEAMRLFVQVKVQKTPE